MSEEGGDFLSCGRLEPEPRPVEERLGDWKQVYRDLPEDKVSEQAGRCLDCGIPFCHALGCPLSNIIPEVNRFVSGGKWHLAYERLTMTNPFPELTGRICPAPCEAACTLAISGEAVSIKEIEKTVGDKGLERGWAAGSVSVEETGKTAAVIGSGPAGLAAAHTLRKRGFSVTVFEKSAEPGGILRFGVPDFKLEKHIIARRVEILRESGVRFETEVDAGEDISASHLRKKFNLILLTVGAGQPRDLDIPGRELEGIYFAMEYLSGVNELLCGLREPQETVNAKGKNVLVLGGGDTGSDCIGTALRQGAAKVYQFEIMPRPAEWGESWNPRWPEYPVILRHSSSQREGAEREWGVLTEKFRGKDGKLTGAEFSRLRYESSSGKPPRRIPGSRFTLDVDMVLLALGFVHTRHTRLLKELGVEYDEKGNIRTTGYMTGVPGVFAAGDAVSGASLAVRAIFAGAEAASAMAEYSPPDAG